MTKEDDKIIREFIDGFEPWHANFEYMKKVYAGAEESVGCALCGIDPAQVKKLRDAVEKLLTHV